MKRATQRVPKAKRPTNVQEREVLNTQECAELLRVHVDTLLAAKDDGPPWFTLGSHKSRPHRLYLKASVLEWARRRQAAA